MRVILVCFVTLFILATAGRSEAACSGSELFSDPFDDNLSGWTQDDSGKIAEGHYSITPEHNRSYSSIIPFYFPVATESVCIDINIIISTPEVFGSAGLIYRADGRNSYYLTTIQVDADGIKLGNWRWANNTWNTLDYSAIEGVELNGKSVDMTVLLKGSVATVYVNGKEAYKFRGQRPENQFQVGVYAQSDTETADFSGEFLDIAVVNGTVQEAQ